LKQQERDYYESTIIRDADIDTKPRTLSSINRSHSYPDGRENGGVLSRTHSETSSHEKSNNDFPLSATNETLTSINRSHGYPNGRDNIPNGRSLSRTHSETSHENDFSSSAANENLHME